MCLWFVIINMFKSPMLSFILVLVPTRNAREEKKEKEKRKNMKNRTKLYKENIWSVVTLKKSNLKKSKKKAKKTYCQR